MLTKRLSNPTQNDSLRLKRLGRYLLGVRDMGLFLPMRGDAEILECYSDSDSAGDACDRKSVACGIITCGGCVLLEYTMGQAVHALSSGEAEYYGGVSLAAEALHMKSVMKFIKMPVRIRLRLDSSAAKAICQRVGVGRVRHLEVRTLWLQAKVNDKKIVVVKQNGDTNIADIGTKVLPAPRFERLRAEMGRLAVASGGDSAESKPERMARIVHQGHDDLKVGMALTMFLNCLREALDQGERNGSLGNQESCKAK